MPRYSLLIFDADETLFDYSKAEAYALETSVSEAGLEFRLPEHLDIYHRINGALWRDYERGEIDRDALKVERFRLFLRELGAEHVDPGLFGMKYLEHLGRTDFMIPGALQILEAFSASHTLALLTNGFSQVQRSRIARTGAGRYFETVIISEEVDFQKPQREIYDILFRSIGWKERDEALMIGDSLSSDILGGINAGIDTCWYNPMKKKPEDDLKPTYEIQSLDELRNIA